MNRVKELCIRNGIEQKELAILVGVTQPTVSEWFNNKTNPRGERLEKLAEIFGVSRSVIMGYDEVPTTEAVSRKIDLPPEQEIDDAIAASSAGLTPDEVQRVVDFIAGIKAARRP